MRKRIRRLLALLLILTAVVTVAAGEEDIEIEELLLIPVEDDYDPFWTFPIALEDMNPEYIRLVNKHYMLDESYVPEDLVKVPNDPRKGGIWHKDAGSDLNGKLQGHHLRPVASEALCKMNAVMREIDGFQNMYLKSGFRSYEKQKTILSRRKNPDDGWVAKPGTSDHQTGLGCDVVPKNWADRGMNEKMMKEKECQWMAEHCQEYGFILRYPSDKKEITEINSEPWHLRYVGIPVATYIMENGLCLEEFTEQLQATIEEYIAQGGDLAKVEAYIQKPTE